MRNKICTKAIERRIVHVFGVVIVGSNPNLILEVQLGVEGKTATSTTKNNVSAEAAAYVGRHASFLLLNLVSPGTVESKGVLP